MSNTFRIKRRAGASALPGAPSTLANAELAFNEANNILYYGKGSDENGVSTSIIPIGGEGAFVTLAKLTQDLETKAGLEVATQTANGLMYANDKKKLDGIEDGADKTPTLAAVALSGEWTDIQNRPVIPAPQVNADWEAVEGVSAIVNKPTIPPAPVQSDWNANEGLAHILNKPTIPPAPVQSDWNATTGLAFIQNKPALGSASSKDTADFATSAQGSKADSAVQPESLATVATSGNYADLNGKPTIPPAPVQSDWNATTGLAFIQNKPTIPPAQVQSDWNATSGSAFIRNKPTLGTAAGQDSGAFATSAQGTKADNAISNSGGVSAIVKLTQAQYDALATKVATTLYVIV